MKIAYLLTLVAALFVAGCEKSEPAKPDAGGTGAAVDKAAKDAAKAAKDAADKAKDALPK